MTIKNESDMLVKLALVSQQMNTLTATVNDIKASMTEIAALDRTLGEFALMHQQQIKENTSQWAKIDSNAEAVKNANEKVDAWVNKGRGAWATLVILGGVVQIIVIAAVTYMFSHLRTVEDGMLIVNHRVEQIERQQPKPLSKP